MEEKYCKDCQFGKISGYRQVICGKTKEWQSELYSCHWWKKRKEKEDK